MQICCECPRKLYEKFNREVKRSTQLEEWKNVSEKIVEAGINVSSITNLRKNVTNWTRRALVCRTKLLFPIFPFDFCYLLILIGGQ